ncbi:hypothetical protein G6F21_014767 [Rhizopus arrhizus]|nr:hypothetical protein G6F21_014767 [Rhizopus arrhizus]
MRGSSPSAITRTWVSTEPRQYRRRLPGGRTSSMRPLRSNRPTAAAPTLASTKCVSSRAPSASIRLSWSLPV